MQSSKRQIEKQCNQYGKCCTKYGNGGLSVIGSEIELS